MRRLSKRIIALMVASVIGVMAMPMSEVHAARAIVEELAVSVDGVELEDGISSIDLSYENNRFINLREMALALNDTEAHFGYELTKEGIELNLEGHYEASEDEDEKSDSKEDSIEDAEDKSEEVIQITCNAGFNDMTIGEDSVKYYTVITDHNDSGDKDCFIAPYDLGMILNIDIQIEDDSKIVIDTKSPFRINPEKLEADGYFDSLNTVVVGNASTGDIYYSYQGSTPYAIASTTKLMTYLILRESMDSSGGSVNDITTISEKVHILSGSDDGVIPMDTGLKVSVRELLYGMLLKSSNECALALAEYAAGSEEAFVQKMNARAGELGLDSAQFNNCHGLPKYTESTISAKLQNRLSGEDMFKLCSYILSVYPDIKDITSTKEIKLEAFNLKVENTNPVLANMPECTGLKTGTTNKAGACLVTSVEVYTSSGTEDLIVVEFGAENGAERSRVSQMLCHYAIDVRTGDADSLYSAGQGYDNEIPRTAEGFINLITKAARQKSLAAK